MKAFVLLALLCSACGSSTGNHDGPTTDAAIDHVTTGDGPGSQSCGFMEAGTCSGAAQCHCCPGAGPTQHCLCTTSCASDGDCHDPALPHCEKDPGQPSQPGFCAPANNALGCCWLCD